MKEKNCKVEGCNNAVKQQGYCSKHYWQVYRHGRLTPETERMSYDDEAICKHDGCTELAECKGYCGQHYAQFWKYGYTYNKYNIENNITFKNDYAVLTICNSLGNHIIDTLIDKEDVEKVKKYKWHYYGKYIDRADRKIDLHRYLMNPPSKYVVDHINHNKLDNRKDNLRICTVAENTWHHEKYKTNTSGKTGVYAEKGLWRARIRKNNKIINLGTYKDKEKAICVRMEAEIKLYDSYKPLI